MSKLGIDLNFFTHISQIDPSLFASLKLPHSCYSQDSFAHHQETIIQTTNHTMPIIQVTIVVNILRYVIHILRYVSQIYNFDAILAHILI